MRNLILSATGLVCLTGVSYFVGTAAAQKNAPADDGPHKVALIDMGYVFNEYEKLKVLQEDFNVEQQTAELDAKQKIEKMKGMQEQIKMFKEGTPEYTKREQEMAKAVSEFETFKKVTERDLLRKRAKMLQTVYLEVQDMVEKIAQRNGYTLVMRFNREELNSGDPQKLMAGLQRQVIYHRPGDDITDFTLRYLNAQWQKANNAAGGPTPKAGQIKRVGGQQP